MKYINNNENLHLTIQLEELKILHKALNINNNIDGAAFYFIKSKTIKDVLEPKKIRVYVDIRRECNHMLGITNILIVSKF